MAAIKICSDFVAQKRKVCHCFHCFPIYFPWGDGTRCHDLSFLNVELYTHFSTLSFTFNKMLFISSSLSAIRVVSSAYLRLLIFLPAILIPSCASSRPAFLMMYSSSLSAVGWCHLHIWDYWYFYQQSWFQLVLHPTWHFTWCPLHIS